MPIIVLLLGAAMSASAHDFFPIRPVHATLRVEPDRIVADLRADSIFWIEEVTGLHPMPASGWPPDAFAKVEAYANSHFRLTAGGRPVEGRLVDARYRQLPWEVNEEGTFFLRLVYDAAPASGDPVSVTARFYEEYKEEIKHELGDRPDPFLEGYRTIAVVPGRRRMTFTLTPDAPSFTVSAGEARRTALAMALESSRRGLESALGAASGFPALLAVALCLGGGAPSRALAAALLAAAAGGFAAGGLLEAPPWLIWAACLGATAAAGGGRLRGAAAAAAAACIGLAWCTAARPMLPHALLALPSALAGALAAGAAMLCAAWLGVRAEYRRLAALSESRVGELFARRVRLTATVLALVGSYGLWQSFPR